MSASLTRLQTFYSEFKPPLLLHAMLTREFPGMAAVATSFGPESALLLALVAEVAPATPVLFLDDGAARTALAPYRESLIAGLRLENPRVLMLGPQKDMWKTQLADLLDEMGTLALITANAAIGAPRIGLDENGVFHINPLAAWTKEEQNQQMSRRNLPPYPPSAAPTQDVCALALTPLTQDGLEESTTASWNL